MATLRAAPEDFRVEEIPRWDPEGAGPHTWLEVEKRDLTTDALLRELAARAGVPGRELGFAGRKDRRAVTRQWVSVPRVDPATARGWAGDGWRVLRAERHREKLRLGELEGNRFEIVVRDLEPPAVEAAIGRLDDLRTRGLVNRFGEQRFGRLGGNAERGFAILRGAADPPPDRRIARLLVSAAQSEVFHRVLDRRGEEPWRVVPGDVVARLATGDWRIVDDPAEVAEDLGKLRVSPTGPLPGQRVLGPRGEAKELEDAVLAGLDVPLPFGTGLPRWLEPRGDRRAIRIPIGRDARAEAGPEEGTLVLRFRLPPGSYATVLLAELLGEEPPDDAAGD